MGHFCTNFVFRQKGEGIAQCPIPPKYATDKAGGKMQTADLTCGPAKG